MTKPYLLFLLVSIVAVDGTSAQRCEHTDLSRKYNYITSTVKTKNAQSGQDEISAVHLQAITKVDKKRIQEIVVKPGRPDGLFDEFTNCSAVRSYLTGKNKNTDAADNDYGDFIVVDFNFDGREDFAIKDDMGGNGGPNYEYYIQGRSGKFQLDSFLTTKMGYFPEIDARRKRLITYVHADVGHYRETVFIFNPTTKKWIAGKSRIRKNLGTE
jgi:hypothetical protein